MPEPKAPLAPVCVENATIADLQAALTAGKLTATDLTRAYLARIAAYDRAGPMLNAIRELNPDAESLAAAHDAPTKKRATKRPPLAGIPILLKDNIATDDRQHTTAGSLALADAYAQRDATVTAKLRQAGAIILGKANLTEFANILAVGMPSGYSSLGGQVRNPYAPALDGRGIPIVPTGGSSAGSAVAVAAGLAAASIGTETSGSLLSPAGQNGLVTIKPTVGLVSRAGIIPIAASQDTAGPMTRTVRDAALILSVLAGPDPRDPATAAAPKSLDYLQYLDKSGLKGTRIGIPSNPADPANDVYWRTLSPAARAVMDRTMTALQDAGATLIRENLPTDGWIGGPGTDMAILNRNPESPDLNKIARLPIVFVYELKHDMNLYLKDWAKGTAMRSLGDIIAFNGAHADRALRFGQDIFLAAESTSGTLQDIEYLAARQNDLRASRLRGLDTYMDENRLDAVLFPATTGAGIAAKAGYPSIQVPAGFISSPDTPEFPLGATFTGRAWSEPTLLRIAYAFEQTTLARRMPGGLPALQEGCKE
jgi:amidase